MNWKKYISLACAAMMALSLTACGGTSEPATSDTTSTTAKQEDSNTEGNFDATREITVISREASSGTRSAFDELMNIKVKEGDTEKDMLFPEAVIVNSTDEVSSKVEVDPFAIGYTSLGSVNDQVKALKVDGSEATEENVKAGTYQISRNLLIATNGEPTDVAADFIQFIQSAQGQQIVADTGFIKANESTEEYTASGVSGKITMSGSTSCEKPMEKMKEAYQTLNPDVTIEINYSGSGAGIQDVLAQKVDIAMASRDLTEEEATTLVPVIFAHDGIAVIVNKDNPISEITSQQITDIFTGTSRTWDAVQ